MTSCHFPLDSCVTWTERPKLPNLVLLQLVWDGLHPLPHLRQLLHAVGLVVQLAADGLEFLASL